jgi:hypothetical protein
MKRRKLGSNLYTVCSSTYDSFPSKDQLADHR